MRYVCRLLVVDFTYAGTKTEVPQLWVSCYFFAEFFEATGLFARPLTYNNPNAPAVVDLLVLSCSILDGQ